MKTKTVEIKKDNGAETPERKTDSGNPGNAGIAFGGYAEEQPATNPGEQEKIKEKSPVKNELAELMGQSAAAENILSNIGDFSKPVPEEKRKRGRRTKAQIAKEKEQEQEQIVIPGILAVEICDSTATGVLSMVDAGVSKIFKTPRVDVAKLSLTDSQKLQISPLAEKAFAAMNLQKDPISAFVGSLAFMYLGNYMLLKTMMQTPDPQTKLFNLNPNKK